MDTTERDLIYIAAAHFLAKSDLNNQALMAGNRERAITEALLLWQAVCKRKDIATS